MTFIFIEPIILPEGITLEQVKLAIDNIDNTIEHNKTNEFIPINPPNVKEIGRECWKNLHSMKDPSIEKIEEWIKTVPSYGCGCQNFAREYIAQNPPDFNNFFEWTWKFHDIVDQKTGDERISFEKAKEIWGV